MAHGPRRHGNSNDFGPVGQIGQRPPSAPWWASVHRDWRFWCLIVIVAAAVVLTIR